MKVIFLDIDGVLNTSETFFKIHNEWQNTGIRRIPIDEFRLIYLKEIVDKTKAKIVLSSSWKNFFKKDNTIIPINNDALELVKLFEKYNLEIYDITPFDKNAIRQNEIKEWLNNNSVDSFVVIDDDSYDLQDFVSKELIKTSFTKNKEMIKNMDDCLGLCEYHIEPILDILNCKIKKYRSSVNNYNK